MAQETDTTGQEQEMAAEHLRAVLHLFALFSLGMTREVERDMRRVRNLSEEAIGEVSNNFLRIGKLSGQLRESLRNETTSDNDSSRMERALLLAEIKTETDTAIRNLQHQDIISQLLNASGGQLLKLEDSAQRIYQATHGEGSLQSDLVQTLHAELEELVKAITSGDAHPVTQASMQAGSVDLF